MIALLLNSPVVRWIAFGVAAMAVAVGIIQWSRMDAVSDYKNDLKARIAEQRLKDVKDGRENLNDLEKLADDDLLEFLLDGLPRPDTQE